MVDGVVEVKGGVHNLLVKETLADPYEYYQTENTKQVGQLARWIGEWGTLRTATISIRPLVGPESAEPLFEVTHHGEIAMAT